MADRLPPEWRPLGLRPLAADEAAAGPDGPPAVGLTTAEAYLAIAALDEAASSVAPPACESCGYAEAGVCPAHLMEAAASADYGSLARTIERRLAMTPGKLKG